MPRSNIIFSTPKPHSYQKTTQADEHLSQLFFEKFDSVNPQLKFEPNYNELTNVGTTYLGKLEQTILLHLYWRNLSHVTPMHAQQAHYQMIVESQFKLIWE